MKAGRAERASRTSAINNFQVAAPLAPNGVEVASRAAHKVCAEADELDCRMASFRALDCFADLLFRFEDEHSV